MSLDELKALIARLQQEHDDLAQRHASICGLGLRKSASGSTLRRKLNNVKAALKPLKRELKERTS